MVKETPNEVGDFVVSDDTHIHKRLRGQGSKVLPWGITRNPWNKTSKYQLNKKEIAFLIKEGGKE